MKWSLNEVELQYGAEAVFFVLHLVLEPKIDPVVTDKGHPRDGRLGHGPGWQGQ
ncbi:MAG: hypothetical protein RMN51_08370 [Verrucomicrobiota bacterium]|nr:hypothetical protein [Limisphaera sp.]MDW8382103.1 hypothetical protein [Verrucomicrobiota bacterium]